MVVQVGLPALLIGLTFIFDGINCLMKMMRCVERRHWNRA